MKIDIMFNKEVINYIIIIANCQFLIVGMKFIFFTARQTEKCFLCCNFLFTIFLSNMGKKRVRYKQRKGLFMKYIKTATTMLLIAATLTSCKTGNPGTEPENSETSGSDTLSGNTFNISLSDSGITVNGKPADNDPEKDIYLSNDIVYYESGKDFTYGEGTEKDAHTVQQAESHTVVNITRPGTYSVSGKLSKGQLAIDLGEDAKDDPGRWFQV